MMKIFVGTELNDRQKDRMQKIADGDPILFYEEFNEGEPMHQSFATSLIAFGNLPATWLLKPNTLRWMQLCSVGFDEYKHLDWSTLEQQITVTNLTGIFAESVAQTALGAILSLYRGGDEMARLKLAHDWQKDQIREKLQVLHRAHVVMVGFGAINRRLAELLEPFQCRFTKLTSESTRHELDVALPSADIVVCAAPETSQTRGLFDASRLDRIMVGALFVSLGRGSIVEEELLADRLRTGRLGGAVLDVTQDEPLPMEHELWDCPNLILTQHTGGGSSDEVDRKITVFGDNMKLFRAGEPLVGVVDWERGY